MLFGEDQGGAYPFANQSLPNKQSDRATFQARRHSFFALRHQLQVKHINNLSRIDAAAEIG